MRHAIPLPSVPDPSTESTTDTRLKMHSKLDLHKHVSCEDIIVELDNCHNENILNRYLGRCNSLKVAMNECLQAEV